MILVYPKAKRLVSCLTPKSVQPRTWSCLHTKAQLTVSRMHNDVWSSSSRGLCSLDVNTQAGQKSTGNTNVNS